MVTSCIPGHRNGTLFVEYLFPIPAQHGRDHVESIICEMILQRGGDGIPITIHGEERDILEKKLPEKPEKVDPNYKKKRIVKLLCLSRLLLV